DTVICEFCEGTFNGQKINLVYYDIDILQNDGVVGGAFDKPEYKACFKGLPEKSAGKYLTPQ
ncbi:MAG: hypothetical protein OEY67_07630, partial [Gammaproteobacteria bacterium]|nr:hypothetical protein [Gammaproteobacteria bacterium]